MFEERCSETLEKFWEEIAKFCVRCKTKIHNAGKLVWWKCVIIVIVI